MNRLLQEHLQVTPLRAYNANPVPIFNLSTQWGFCLVSLQWALHMKTCPCLVEKERNMQAWGMRHGNLTLSGFEISKNLIICQNKMFILEILETRKMNIFTLVIELFLSIFLSTRPSCWWMPISMSSCLRCEGIFTCDAWFLHRFSFLCNMSQPVLPFIATEMIPISFKKDLNLKFFLIWFLNNLCDCSNPKLF